MIKVTLLYFLISHFIADYYLQSDQLSNNKHNNLKSLLKHAIIYQIVMIIPFIISGLNLWYLLIGFIIGISHLVIDLVKKQLQKNQEKENTLYYLLDQALHISIIIILANAMGNRNTNLLYQCIINYSLKNIKILKLCLIALVIFKPANITFKIAYKKFKPQDDENQEGNAGAIIGNYERLLYCLCLAFNQYTLIGLIITCKGFARHSNIQKVPRFAEYFLIGTLYSILYSVFSYILIFYLI